jgi:hypothetical protein
MCDGHYVAEYNMITNKVDDLQWRVSSILEMKPQWIYLFHVVYDVELLFLLRPHQEKILVALGAFLGSHRMERNLRIF